MEHPNFADAGSAPGVEVWVIDKFEPVRIDEKMYGKFYTGDAYIVLKTSGTSNSPLTYNAHFWLGSNSSQDKQGSAAILTVALDDQLGGRAVQHREVQQHESSLFLGYFQPAIRYLDGGNESGFTEVETNAGAEKRLLKLTGSDNLRIQEVPANSSSLTRDNCFILEVDHDIFVLMPDTAKAAQRRKIIAIANTLRDDYHNGRATIEIIDEFSSDDDWQRFFETLGSGSKDEMAEESDVTITSRGGKEVFLHKILLGADNELQTLHKPYRQTQLESGDVYILDTPCSGTFVWVGSDVDSENKKNYIDIVKSYLESQGYPSWTHVTRVSQGMESAVFKQFFDRWDSIDSSQLKKLVTDSDSGFDSDEDTTPFAKKIGKSAAASSYMPDDGTGNIQVLRISDEVEDITEKFQSEIAVFYSSETYVLKYNYQNEDGEDMTVIYNWVGGDATTEDKSKAIDTITELEDELSPDVIIVLMPCGKETKHFLSIFKGTLVVLFSDKSTGYAPDNAGNNYEDTGVRLFKVTGTEIGVDMRALQVSESTDSLNDDDVFILETKEVIYVRNGKDSDPSEQEAALEFVKSIINVKEVVVFDQGEETSEFWEALGGEPEDTNSKSVWQEVITKRANADRTLTAVNVAINGTINFEELPPNFTQQDLSDDGVYILDNCEEIYMWEGQNIPERMRRLRTKIITLYISDDGLNRTEYSTVSVSVRQGREPPVFTNMFPQWDNSMWENSTTYEDLKKSIN